MCAGVRVCVPVCVAVCVCVRVCVGGMLCLNNGYCCEFSSSDDGRMGFGREIAPVSL